MDVVRKCVRSEVFVNCGQSSSSELGWDDSNKDVCFRTAKKDVIETLINDNVEACKVKEKDMIAKKDVRTFE